MGQNLVLNMNDHGYKVAVFNRTVSKVDEFINNEAKGTQVEGAHSIEELVGLLKTGSAFYAPAASAVEMVGAILRDRKKILPCTAYLEGEYGIQGLYVGVPVKLGRRGIEQIIQIRLTPEEQAALHRSAAAVRELTDKLGV